MRQAAMRREYPEHRYVLGDVCDLAALTLAAAGHDLIIHAAAQKHIPEAEAFPDHCYHVNVTGSQNVLRAAASSGVGQVLGISTDKACWPINTYGCSKLMMERLYQQFALAQATVRVNLVRYGNVLGSTGSVIPVWEQALARGETPKITDPDMTRFWLTSDQAVDLIVFALEEPSGTVTIPRLPGLRMGRMLDYLHPGSARDVIGLRPGEKLHEMLVTPQEMPFASAGAGVKYIRLYPVTTAPRFDPSAGYTSDTAPELTRAQLLEMLA
jgi:UDP-N-acetylglucosamine 4,6-dehydratase